MFKKNGDYKGQLLYGDKLVRFHTFGIGQKLGYIREILEEEYGAEYSRGRVAKEIGISHQGLYYSEVNSKGNLRKGNLYKLVEIYNIPHSLLKDSNEKTNSKFKVDPVPIFIGKPEDHELYLEDVKQQQSSMMNSLIHFTPSDHDLLEVDFEMLAYIPNSPVIHRRDKFARRVKLTLEDIKTLKELIGKQIDIIASRREAFEKLQKEEL